jgi:hypothetical protein
MQTAISSACIEHLDFLNHSMCPTFEWQSMAISEHRSTHDITQYKSLTDVTKTLTIAEDIDYINHVRAVDVRTHVRLRMLFDEHI